MKDVTRELKVHRGTTQLEQFIIILRGPFGRECLLNDYIIYLRTYEKQYCVIAVYCDNCQNHVYVLFGTDSDQNGMLEEIPRSGTDSYR